MMSYLTWSRDTGKISKDNKILTENLRDENEWGSKKMSKEFLAEQWYKSGLNAFSNHSCDF